jgi:hypothetical protein
MHPERVWVDGPIATEPASPRPATAALIAANINPATGLATDYLNHFNEITMLLGLVAEMPEVIEDLAAWQPASYEVHFERSGFSCRALAIDAYRSAPMEIREALEVVVAELDATLLDVIDALRASPPNSYAAIVEKAEATVRPLMGRANAIIHGVGAQDLYGTNSGQAVADFLMD